MSYEFKFVNNIAYVEHKEDPSIGRIAQSFDPSTQQPWINEEDARAWAFLDYGYLLVSNITEIPTTSTHTTLPGWPLSNTSNERTHITTDTGDTWYWNDRYWDNLKEEFIITGTVATHTELPGYPSSFSGAIGIKYIVSQNNHVWRWNSLIWFDEGEFFPRNTGVI